MPQTYVRRGGLDVQPAPWRANAGVHGYIFMVPADRAALQRVIDRTLNHPSNGRFNYHPVETAPGFHFVALTFQHFDGLHSTSDRVTQRAMHTYTEASFWILVSDPGRPEPIELLIPYMFVDNWIALCAGREVFGFPKELATVRMPQRDPGPCSVTTLTMREPGVRRPANDSTVVMCTPSGPGFDAGLGLIIGNRELWDILKGITHNDILKAGIDLVVGPISGLLDMLVDGRLSLVFLRQMLGVAGTGEADFQQIVSARADPFQVDDLIFHSPYSIRIEDFGSHPIAEDLGLQLDANREIVAPFCMEVDVKFGLERGLKIWP